MPGYYLTHVGGLSGLVADELAEKLPTAHIVQAEYGRLHLDFAGDPAALLALRTIENAYVRVQHLSGVRAEASWLEELKAAVTRVDLTPALEALRQVRSLPDAPTFRVTCERSGSHHFRSQQAAGATGAAIVGLTGWGVDLSRHDLEVRLDIREDEALLGLRLSAQALHRRSRLVHPRVTLNPTVAAAMVRLSDPHPGEVVCDPMLGGGTILTERYDYDPIVTLVGGDLHPEKTALARQNFVGLGVPARLAQWDARRLPLQDASVDKFLCNPPWGNLISDRQFNRHTYPSVLWHLRRCLKPGGLMVLITSERKLVQSFVDRHEDIHLVRTDRLNLGGLHPSIHVLRKDC